MSLADALALPVNSDVGQGGAGAPDTSAPPASTDTSPATPVDVAQPSPVVTAPPSDAASVGQVTGAAAQPEPSWSDASGLPPSAPVLAHQSRIVSMVRGLLMGLQSGGGVGAAIGAVEGAASPDAVSQKFEDQREIRQAAKESTIANLKLSSVRAALGILQAGRDRQMLDSLPDPLVEMHDQVAQDQINSLAKNGAKPLVTPDNPGAMQAVMNELHTRYGSVPFYSVIHHGGLLYVYPVANGTSYADYASTAKETGQDPVSQDVWNGLKPEQQAEAMHGLNSFFTSVPDSQHIDQAIQQTKLARATYNANTPSWQSNKASVLKKYDDRLQFLQQSQQYYDARDRQYIAQQAAAKARAEQQVAHNGQDQNGNWDPSSIPVMLVEGQMDPSQLSKRVSKGYSMNDVLSNADRYSRATYGVPFNVAQATSDYKYATNPQNQNTLKMIDGMTEQGGALDIVANAAKNLPAMNASVVNKVFGTAQTQFGDQSITNFHTAMLGLADEYSKVMGGGVSSDTGRQQALDILKDGYSKGQIAGAIGIIRSDIAARKNAIIGTNRYLQHQYGQQKAVAPAAQQQVTNTPGAQASNAAPTAGGFFSKIPGAKVRNQ